MENRCIYHQGKVVTTFQHVFDAILEAHSSIGHSRDHRKHKDYLRDNLKYYGIPGPAVQMFINTCLTVSRLLHECFSWFSSFTYILLPLSVTQCLNHARDTPATQPALKIIISK